MIVFDIETAALPWGILKDRIPPFDEEKAVPHPGDFDPMAVAIGNLKDQAKIDAKIDEARGKHALELKQLAHRRAAARNEHVARYTEKAALSATTGCVKAIGWMADGEPPMVIYAGDPPWGLQEGAPDAIMADAVVFGCEAEVIKWFWSAYRGTAAESLVGHNIHGFDLPFLVCRSWILGVDVPDGVQQQGGRYWSNQFVDTMARWNCGNRNYIKLDEIDRALGGPGKPDDRGGADFARLFDNGGEDRIKALKYLANDLAMTRRVAEAMQIL
jgi:hypothetical protein